MSKETKADRSLGKQDDIEFRKFYSYGYIGISVKEKKLSKVSSFGKIDCFYIG